MAIRVPIRNEPFAIICHGYPAPTRSEREHDEHGSGVRVLDDISDRFAHGSHDRVVNPTVRW